MPHVRASVTVPRRLASALSVFTPDVIISPTHVPQPVSNSTPTSHFPYYTPELGRFLLASSPHNTFLASVLPGSISFTTPS